MNDERLTKKRHAFRVALILLGAVVVTFFFFLYFSWRQSHWQIRAMMGIALAFGVLLGISMSLFRRDRFDSGIWLIVAGLLVVFPIISALIAGMGWILGIGLVLMITSLVAQTLSGRPASRAILASALSGTIILLVDVFGPADRLSLPQFQWFSLIVIPVIVLAYSVFVARQFSDYSLRTKLIASFLVISLVSVGLISFTLGQIFQNELERNLGRDLNRLAESEARAVANMLTRQANTLQALSLNRFIQNEVIFANESYVEEHMATVDTEAILAEIKAIDAAWTGAEADDALIQSRLSNSLAWELARFRRAFPDHTELFVTDQYGAIVAATGRTSDFYQADEAWWQQTFAEGQGDLFIGGPAFDESSDTFGLIIAVPIYAPNTQTLIGILRSTFSLEALHALLASSAQPGSAGVDLYIPGLGLFERHTGDEIGSAGEAVSLIEFDSQILTRIERSAEPYLETDYEGRPSLVSFTAIASVTAETFIKTLNWAVIAHQDQTQALVPLTIETNRTIALLTVFVLVIAAVGAVFISQTLIRPIARLTAVAERVAAGNVSGQAAITSQDEVGTLAQAFNDMTDQLQQTIGAFETRVTERTQQIELVLGLNRRLSSILDLNELMREMVTVTKETFNYYHVHVYLVDEERENLVMMEGYGEAGQIMKSQEHAIALNSPASLIALAARRGEAVIIENVQQEPNWLPNPLLPETQSEIAMPVMLEGRVEGVLDVQSDRVGGLTTADVLILRALADQVAIAIRNAQLFAQTETALEQAQKLQSLYTDQAWERFTHTQPNTAYDIAQADHLPPLDQASTPEASLALQKKGTVQLSPAPSKSASRPAEPTAHENGPPGNAPPTAGNGAGPNAVAAPLRLGTNIIGVLGIQDENKDRRWTDDEIALIEAVTEQMSLALENARLFTESRQRAVRERIIADMTRQVWASGDLEAVMRSAVQQLGTNLGTRKVIIHLGTENQLLSLDTMNDE